MAFANYIRNIFDSSIFDKSSYSKTVNAPDYPYRITISPVLPRTYGGADLSIIGVLKGKLNLNMQPEYDDLGLGSFANNSRLISSIINYGAAPLAAAGVSVGNTGILTEKFYKKGGYLTIEPEFTVVDWDGTGMPILAAVLLLNYCVPKRGEQFLSIEDVLEDLKSLGADKALDYAKQVIDEVEGIVKSIGGNIKSTGFVDKIKSTRTFSKTKSTLGPPSRRGLDTLSKGSINITSSPTPVRVTISNFFEHDNMIVEGVNVELHNDKMTKTGPIQADFKVTLSTKEMPSVGKLGFKIKSRSRVRVLNTTGT